MSQEDYLTERVVVRLDPEIVTLITFVSKKYKINISDVLREVIHEVIRENHEIVKRGMIQRFNGFDKI